MFSHLARLGSRRTCAATLGFTTRGLAALTPGLTRESSVTDPSAVLTKIVGTIGPVSEDAPTLQKCVDAGLQIIRINFSHATYDEAEMRVANLRSCTGAQGNLDLNLRGTLLDTGGPEIRTGLVGDDGQMSFVEGEVVHVSNDESWREAFTSKQVYVSYVKISNVLAPGNLVLLDDGKVALEVEKLSTGGVVECRVLNGGLIGSRKGVNLPGVELKGLPAMTEKDREDLVWGVKADVDFVGKPFCKPRVCALLLEYVLCG